MIVEILHKVYLPSWYPPDAEHKRRAQLRFYFSVLAHEARYIGRFFNTGLSFRKVFTSLISFSHAQTKKQPVSKAAILAYREKNVHANHTSS